MIDTIPPARIRDGEEHDILACVKCGQHRFVILVDERIGCPDCGATSRMQAVLEGLRRLKMN